MRFSRTSFSSARFQTLAHRLTATAVLLALCAVYVRRLLERGSPERLLAIQVHHLLGIAVLLLAVPWVLMRLHFGHASTIAPVGRRQRMAAVAVHAALFLLMIVQPVLGIVAKMARGRGIDLPGWLGVIPSVWGRHPVTANLAQDAHVLVGTLACYLIGLHATAAAWHWLRARRRAPA